MSFLCDHLMILSNIFVITINRGEDLMTRCRRLLHTGKKVVGQNN